ncbi:histone H1 [Cavenderia fasciculata]|uniref:Histone H1 n=1 Tax=Cavenderia fasciculata TaxID=261658 RepID=F4QDQ8_CACFS|nr:histone H1 [Cavenderia fasciculata]EGG13855.1 histone H1 [Cavenderia fasciculata]|eukprot:XP_004350563.1 histone H1 [Cavenderia fasciculata]
MKLSVSKIENAKKLSKLCSVLSKISNELNLILTPDLLKIVVKTDISDGTEVWYESPIEFFFDKREVQSVYNNIIGLQISTSEFKQVLNSILSMGGQETSLRLRRDQKLGVILKFDIKQQARTQVITQDLSVTVLNKTTLEELQEPMFSAPVSIMLPPLKHLMGVMDRLKNISDDLVIEANNSGHLKFTVETHFGKVTTMYHTANPPTPNMEVNGKAIVKVDIRKFVKVIASHQLDADQAVMVLKEGYSVAFFLVFKTQRASLAFYLPIKLNNSLLQPQPSTNKFPKQPNNQPTNSLSTMSTKKSTSSTKKAPAAKKTPSHPPYFDMISAAIAHYKDRTGSSIHAIKKYMEENYTLGDNWETHFKVQLKRAKEDGKLVQVKASYKLPPKTAAAPATKKPAAKKGAKKAAAASPATDAAASTDSDAEKKAATKKAAAPKKPAAPKKTAPAKKAAPKKPAAKKNAKKAAK